MNLKNPKFKIPSWVEEKNIEEYKERHIKDLRAIRQTIMKGKVWARILSVSSSGMSRKIMFIRIKHNSIENITPEIAWLTGNSLIGDYKDGKYTDNGLNVGGCGMDMVFHTLYNALSNNQSRKWKQKHRMF